MSLWALITDLHFGVRNDSKVMYRIFKKFYLEVFFPYLVEHNIKTVFVLGDFFDRRKFISFETLALSKEIFFDQLKHLGITCYMITGNHDVVFRNTNELNSLELLIKEEYENVKIFRDPEVIEVDGCKVLMLPWMTASNFEDSVKLVCNSGARVVMSHLEMAGFEYHRGLMSTHGHVEQDAFFSYDYVFSGHYHHKSSRGNIHYLGTPYELTWSDYDDPRGFHTFDGESLSFIKNTQRNFIRLVYDDREVNTVKRDLETSDFSEYKDRYLKIVVKSKRHPIIFEQFLDKLFEADAADINVLDETNQELVQDVSEEAIEEASKDTISVIVDYIDGYITTDLDKTRLKSVLQSCLQEAQEFTEEG